MLKKVETVINLISLFHILDNRMVYYGTIIFNLRYICRNHTRRGRRVSRTHLCFHYFFLSQDSKRRTRVRLVRAIISRASSHARVIKNKKTKEVSGNNNANGHRCEGAQSQSGS